MNLLIVSPKLHSALEHLNVLSMNFDRYFPLMSEADIQKTRWILNPFLKDKVNGTNLTNSEQEVLAEMHCDSHMRDMFKQCHRTKFWAKAFTEEHSVADPGGATGGHGPPQTMVKFFSHLVIQTTDRFFE